MAVGRGLGKRVSGAPAPRVRNGLSQTRACAQCQRVRTGKGFCPRVRRCRTRRGAAHSRNPISKAVGWQGNSRPREPEPAHGGGRCSCWFFCWRAARPVSRRNGCSLRLGNGREGNCTGDAARAGNASRAGGATGPRANSCSAGDTRCHQSVYRDLDFAGPLVQGEWFGGAVSADGRASAGLRAEHAPTGFSCCAQAARWRIGTGWKSGWHSRRRCMDGQPYVHALDLKKTIQPLVLGTHVNFLKTNLTIVIDPGHGGMDSGTRVSWATGTRRNSRWIGRGGWVRCSPPTGGRCS